MRENFMIALSGVNAKGEDIGVVHVFLHHIVYVLKTDKGTMISLSNGSSVTIKEGIDEIIKRTANYGLVRAI